MVNVNKLKAKFVERGMSIEQAAEFVGIERSKLYRRFREPTSFSISEVNNIVHALQLTAEDAMAIFFADEVA